MCPECRGSKTRARERGFDREGRFVRVRKCVDCGHRFTTLELPVPLPFGRFDTTRRLRNREYQRRRRGYHGGHGGTPAKPEPQLIVKVTVVE